MRPVIATACVLSLNKSLELVAKYIIWICRDMMKFVNRDDAIIETFDSELVNCETKSRVLADKSFTFRV